MKSRDTRMIIWVNIHIKTPTLILSGSAWRQHTLTWMVAHLTKTKTVILTDEIVELLVPFMSWYHVDLKISESSSTSPSLGKRDKEEKSAHSHNTPLRWDTERGTTFINAWLLVSWAMENLKAPKAELNPESQVEAQACYVWHPLEASRCTDEEKCTRCSLECVCCLSLIILSKQKQRWAKKCHHEGTQSPWAWRKFQEIRKKWRWLCSLIKLEVINRMRRLKCVKKSENWKWSPEGFSFAAN